MKVITTHAHTHTHTRAIYTLRDSKAIHPCISQKEEISYLIPPFKWALFLLFFKYSCLHFLPTTLPCPTDPYLPPSVLPHFGFVHESFIHVPWWPFPFFPPLSPFSPPLWSLSVCSLFRCLWSYFACLFVQHLIKKCLIFKYEWTISPRQLRKPLSWWQKQRENETQRRRYSAESREKIKTKLRYSKRQGKMPQQCNKSRMLF